MESKRCSKCLISQSTVQFSHNRNGKDGRRSTCKQCDLERSRMWKAKRRASFKRDEVDRSIVKTCSICQMMKSGGSFYLDSSTRDGLQTLCKDCGRANTARWQKEGKYGLAPGDYLRMLDEQNETCAICGTDNPGKNNRGEVADFCIDHCHKTKRVRGLLCYACNRGLGDFRDNPVFLHSAIIYLTGDEG